MVFLDTCVWIELCGVKTPQNEHEIRQAKVAGQLLSRLLSTEEKIITFQEQLLEVISAVQKVKMKVYNKDCKETAKKGVRNIKEFRAITEFKSTKELCSQVCGDICYFSEVLSIGEIDIEDILSRIDIADLNDCMYYDYCSENNIEIYTFDTDYGYIDVNKIVHII